MKIAEDKDKGLLVVAVDDAHVLRYARMKYDGSLRLWRSDSVIPLSDFCTWPTKAEACDAASRLGFTHGHVDRVGSRFWSCWGIRHDLRDNYFLAIYE